MQLKEQLFFKSPPTVRQAFAFLAAGWVSLLAFIYHINFTFPATIHPNNAVRVALVGIGIGYFVFRIKPWARTLCIFFNIGIVGINALFIAIRVSALGLASPALTLHALLSAVLFGLSTYFLLLDPTARFFRQQLPKPPEKSGSEGRENSSR